MKTLTPFSNDCGHLLFKSPLQRLLKLLLIRHLLLEVFLANEKFFLTKESCIILNSYNFVLKYLPVGHSLVKGVIIIGVLKRRFPERNASVGVQLDL